ncbi:hypothetical protein [Nocardia donostiensis]|nr:hypothetical protein [Nocardia donostiensis]
MKSNWDSMRDPNLDPEIEAAARRVMDSIDGLRTARIRAENMDVASVLHEPTVVTDELMFEFAALPYASPELRYYAERVRNGECRWQEIELLMRPLPPEVLDLRSSPNFIWPWKPEPPPPPPAASTSPGQQRQRNADRVVGPSDWPDDFDDYPGSKSWLV